jgi:DNA-binding transcriptional ArsR family regulator
MTTAQPAKLDRIFHALSDRSRRSMVERLSQGPASVTELAAPLSMALPSVLKHLRVLEEGGIVLSQKRGRVRTYRIEPRALALVEEWTAARKAMWNRQFDRLDEFLAEETRDDEQGR